MLIAHLSDAHIGPLPPVLLHELLNKRLTGFINWKRGRSRTHDMPLLSRLLADIGSHRPDHIAMTGDIVNIGLAGEFPLARAFLEQLGAPGHVSFVPGNHDAYVRAALAPMRHWLGPWMTGDGAAASRFPYVRQRDGVALIGLSSGVPTLPFLASGTLGTAQLAAFADILADLGRAGLCRVVMVHHPPHLGGAKPGRGLTDAAEFERTVARAGAEIILHGHNHKTSLATIPGPGGSAVPILGAPSVSAVSGTHDHRAGYHLLHIVPDGARSAISLTTRGHDPQTGAIATIGERTIR
ncbi:3',5'-cyclic AMP phosphodiesterase CpdA [Pseudochelatococcus lubricantis]|uniref:3',5'-cyclic AMP phosphodiesterase CpdA n=1 Tax=Pseudochelatococcus lubricantis TaxID=1538102 RepID=A0ABX0UZ97_9HYPH|nr:metallophosphoesterase [Pseudochelatococcus lubricantis]NIJ57703.1 3',5'-cyclic AMP phosphodiesterase CpdA [Pseudochelatococcus lubricantis]